MKDKRILKMRTFFIIIAVLIRAYHTFILVRRFILEDVIDDWFSAWMLGFYITGLARFLMDLFVIISAFKYFLFVVRRRIQGYEGKIPTKSKLRIVWFSFVVLLVGLEVGTIFILSLFLPSANDSIFQLLTSYQRYLIYPALEIILASTITYVFYHQGQTMKRATMSEHNTNENSLLASQLELEEDDDEDEHLASGNFYRKSQENLINLSS